MFSLFTLKMIIVRVGFTFCYFFTHFISFLFLFICLPLWLTSMTQFSSVQLLSRVWLFVTPWIAACQASLSITNSRSLPKLTSVESVMQSSHLSLCRPLLLLPPIPPSIRVFSNESTLRMRWPKYWSFSFNISPLPYLLSLLIFSFICKHTQNIYSLTLFFFINTLNMSFHPACWAPLFLISSQFLIILLTTISVLLLSRFSLWLWLSAIWQCVIVGVLCLYYLGLCYLGFMNIWDLLDSIFHQIWQVLDITSSFFFFFCFFFYLLAGIRLGDRRQGTAGIHGWNVSYCLFPILQSVFYCWNWVFFIDLIHVHSDSLFHQLKSVLDFLIPFVVIIDSRFYFLYWYFIFTNLLS